MMFLRWRLIIFSHSIARVLLLKVIEMFCSMFFTTLLSRWLESQCHLLLWGFNFYLQWERGPKIEIGTHSNKPGCWAYTMVSAAIYRGFNGQRRIPIHEVPSGWGLIHLFVLTVQSFSHTHCSFSCITFPSQKFFMGTIHKACYKTYSQVLSTK